MKFLQTRELGAWIGLRFSAGLVFDRKPGSNCIWHVSIDDGIQSRTLEGLEALYL